MSGEVRRVVIVGGGSAGWLTAGIVAADHFMPGGGGLQVTLVESPIIGQIGVGEGTWPTMRDSLRRIGVSETDFLRDCDASFKQGSKFVGWVTGNPGDYYYHPFVLPQGFTEVDLVAQWQRHHASVPFADLVSFQPHLCERGLAPKQVTTPEYAAVANYAYHLDAGKFGSFLQRHCTSRLGVRHVVDHVIKVEAKDNGDIAALATAEHGRIEGDLFIDCSGSGALLIGRHFGVPFVSQRHLLFNDAALAVQVPYAGPEAPVASHTISTARSTGWIWDIGLPTRRGVGHVFSTAYTTEDEVEQVLRTYVAGTAGTAAAEAASPRRLNFEPGYRQSLWHRNCVAVGMAAGFIEPLEASALALVEFSAGRISNELPTDRTTMDIVARRYNEAFLYRWERVVDFLKLHYVLSSRADSAFWVDNRLPETMPARLKESLALWRHRAPSRNDFFRVEEIFPSASYHYVLYGMGFRPDPAAMMQRPGDAERADGCFREAARLTRSMLGALPTNRALLNHLRQHRLQPV